MRRTLGLFVALCAVASLTACSSSKTTCEDFGKQEPSDRMNTIMSMIEEHDLDPASSYWGTASVGSKVYTFCGLDAMDLVTNTSSPATQNLSSPIENAIDWSQYGA